MSINKLRQISTKTGDKGISKNYDNEEFSKNHILFETVGSIDELSSFLGLTYHISKLELIKTIQIHLQKISSQISTNKESNNFAKLNLITNKEVTYLEELIQLQLEKTPIKNQFYLPGSEKTETGAYFDVSRTIARRSERRIVEFSNSEKRDDLHIVKMYLNRLSDLLFVLSINT
ncbi:MAG: cob(I)yrinic acid a,c-diamide adenosyltransferase [Candidatus Izimaplasma sp.]|nr:cob(I)yrinic acid a,c-diamide adenosyltransferase [Candidatus Izimaplasma bacterium]